MIQFGQWLPDQADLLNPGVTVATNVLPAAQGYHSMSSFVPYSNAATGTIKGIFAAKDSDSNTKLFAGDATKLYLHASSDNDLDDISKGAGYDLTDTERWRFVQFGDDIIGVGGTGEEPQVFNLGTSSAFADLGGSPPKLTSSQWSATLCGWQTWTLARAACPISVIGLGLTIRLAGRPGSIKVISRTCRTVARLLDWLAANTARS